MTIKDLAKKIDKMPSLLEEIFNGVPVSLKLKFLGTI